MVPLNARVIAEKNAVIGGFQFSKKVGLLFSLLGFLFYFVLYVLVL